MYAMFYNNKKNLQYVLDVYEKLETSGKGGKSYDRLIADYQMYQVIKLCIEQNDARSFEYAALFIQGFMQHVENPPKKRFWQKKPVEEHLWKDAVVATKKEMDTAQQRGINTTAKLLSGYIRRIENSATNKIMPNSIRSLCFEFIWHNEMAATFIRMPKEIAQQIMSTKNQLQDETNNKAEKKGQIEKRNHGKAHQNSADNNSVLENNNALTNDNEPENDNPVKEIEMTPILHP